jgi:hypothetical protein
MGRDVALRRYFLYHRDLLGGLADNDLSGKLQLAVQNRPSLSFAFESQHADLGELLGLLAPSGEDETEDASPYWRPTASAARPSAPWG